MINHEFINGKQIQFLTVEEGRAAILEEGKNPFFSLLTRIDMEARMRKSLGPNHQNNLRTFKDFVAQSVEDFGADEIRIILGMLDKIYIAAEPCYPKFIPDVWKFIKTSGKEEGGAFYTRNDCIVMPSSRFYELLKSDKEGLLHIFCHETAHLEGQYHSEKREKLYNYIGFYKIDMLDLGKFISEHRITNPDAPVLNYGIQIENEGRKIITVPVVFSQSAEYSPEKNNFFDYIQFGLCEIELKGAIGHYEVIDGDKPIFLAPEKVKGFFEQIGKNTHYIIHPEEIIADNIAFSILLKMGVQKEYEDMHIIDKIDTVFRS